MLPHLRCKHSRLHTLLPDPLNVKTLAKYKNRRKDFTEKAQEKMTPDSQKSMVDKAKEGATSTYDQAAGAVQPSPFYPTPFS